MQSVDYGKLQEYCVKGNAQSSEIDMIQRIYLILIGAA